MHVYLYIKCAATEWPRISSVGPRYIVVVCRLTMQIPDGNHQVNLCACFCILSWIAQAFQFQHLYSSAFCKMHELHSWILPTPWQLTICQQEIHSFEFPAMHALKLTRIAPWMFSVFTRIHAPERRKGQGARPMRLRCERWKWKDIEIGRASCRERV